MIIARSLVLIGAVMFIAPKAIREMRIWEKQTQTYRKRTAHEFTLEEGSINAK